MKSLRPALWGLGAAGLLFGLFTAALIATTDTLSLRGVYVAVVLWVGWSFIGVGLFAWLRRPDNRVGALMVGTGFAGFVGAASFSDIPVFFTIGNVFGSVYIAIGVHLLLAFPSGRLETPGARRLVVSGYVLACVLVIPLYFFAGPEQIDCAECPDNLLLIEPSQTATDALSMVLNVAALVLISALIAALATRWSHATKPQRRVLAGVYLAGVAMLTAFGVSMALQTGGAQADGVEQVVWIVALILFGLVPYGFLASLIRARIIQGGAVAELVARLGEAPQPGELRDALARALGDDSLELVYWLPDRGRFVDLSGRPVELPALGADRAMTMVEQDGERVAALVHDASLLEDPEHVRAVGAAAALALENERLEAELHARLEELSDSRQRMVRAAVAERQRLERDLHDGAQQRLVSLAIDMRVARDRLREDPDGAEELLSVAGRELEAALEELRELARGIHPAVITDRGLEAALESLARRAPLPVEVAGTPAERLPEPVELAAYFVVAEALTNVAKYARASRATVAVSSENGSVLVEVSDDGVGGADPGRGSGLRGLEDRLCALDGQIAVESAPGSGTTVRATIPCA